MNGEARETLLVCAGDWLGVAELPFLLKEAGCRVTALTPPGTPLSSSSRVDELIPGERDAARMAALLERHLASRGAPYDWIVIGDDPLVRELAARADEPWIKDWFLARPDRAGALTSKAEFSRFAASAGLPMARGIEARGAAEILSAAERLGYPVLLKPVNGSAGTGIVRADGAAELKAAALPEAETILVEKFVTGRLGQTVALFDHGRPALWTSSLKTEVWPEPYGPSCTRTVILLPEIEGILARLGEALGLTALCGVDWILPESGGPVVIELNPRPVPYSSMATQLGQDLPAAIADMLAGRQATRRPSVETEGRVFQVFPARLVKAIARKDWRRVSEGKILFPWGDPGLLYWMTRDLSGAAARRVLSALRLWPASRKP